MSLYRISSNQSNSLVFSSGWGGNNTMPKPGHTLPPNCPDIVFISNFLTLSFAACLLEPYAASLFFSYLCPHNLKVMPQIYIPVRGEQSHASNNWPLLVCLADCTGKGEWPYLQHSYYPKVGSCSLEPTAPGGQVLYVIVRSLNLL